jgi:hypothetical protein
MISIRILGLRNSMKQLEREKDAFIGRVAQDTLVVARKNTPIDTGLARNGWRLENMFQQKRIVNRTRHINYLERGRSKQAPNGILGPTVREISKRRYKI